jgi:hypothetical protein
MKVQSENNRRARSWGMFPGLQHFEGRRACWSFGMGLGRRTNNYLITQICINQTQSWLVHSLSTFGVRMSHGQPRIHKTHHSSNLGEATTFPLIVFFAALHGGHIQMAFCPRTPKWESQNFHN